MPSAAEQAEPGNDDSKGEIPDDESLESLIGDLLDKPEQPPTTLKTSKPVDPQDDSSEGDFVLAPLDSKVAAKSKPAEKALSDSELEFDEAKLPTLSEADLVPDDELPAAPRAKAAALNPKIIAAALDLKTSVCLMVRGVVPTGKKQPVLGVVGTHPAELLAFLTKKVQTSPAKFNLKEIDPKKPNAAVIAICASNNPLVFDSPNHITDIPSVTLALVQTADGPALTIASIANTKQAPGANGEWALNLLRLHSSALNPKPAAVPTPADDPLDLNAIDFAAVPVDQIAGSAAETGVSTAKKKTAAPATTRWKGTTKDSNSGKKSTEAKEATRIAKLEAALENKLRSVAGGKKSGPKHPIPNTVHNFVAEVDKKATDRSETPFIDMLREVYANKSENSKLVYELNKFFTPHSQSPKTWYKTTNIYHEFAKELLRLAKSKA